MGTAACGGRGFKGRARVRQQANRAGMQDVVQSKSGTEAQNWWPCASKGHATDIALSTGSATRSPTTPFMEHPSPKYVRHS